MQWLVDYFGQIPSSHRSAILVGGILFFWLIEGTWPLFQFKYHKWEHAGVNFFFTLTTILVNFPLAFILVKSSAWTVENNFGILHIFPNLPYWIQAVAGVLILDMVGAWTAHWIQHQIKFLWRFHIIHHADPHVDTTTANRHHPGESLIRFVFTTLAILISGAPMWIVFLYQSLSVLLSQFNHANIIMPSRLDKFVSFLLVTPNMHHVHHHYMQPYTDSNYGNIFSVWDHVFRTFKKLDQQKIVYGIDTHLKPEENSTVSNLLRIPFQEYRSANSENLDKK